MEEKRKHAILFAATLLCARKLIEVIDSDKPNWAKQSEPKAALADHMGYCSIKASAN